MYSQNAEEQYIFKATAHIENGRFLDIGAWDPKKFSNTRALYEKGWSGVMVEPSPVPFTNLLKEYGGDSRIQLVLAAVSSSRELVEMNVTEDCYSTTEAGNFEKWKNVAKFCGGILVGTVSIEHLLTKGPFDFINIDVEGTSVDILLEMALALKLARIPEPACICVEHDGRTNELERWANFADYQALYMSAENVVFSK